MKELNSNNCGNCANWAHMFMGVGKCNIREGNVFDDFVRKFTTTNIPEHKRCVTSKNHSCIGHLTKKIMPENSNNIIHKVMINGYEYFVDNNKRLLYTDEKNAKKGTNGHPYSFLTQNERAQVWNQVHFKNEHYN